ncbi:hypothetical protein [Deminuibacter soli]|uniref:Uncharacterized protein n=1 Tax=Deminuibacter soli TaxID=2291815 RepID=A0A3E1NH44_9BACT|nr:hypothetical protein [Deminuibacter soli]RFM27263.1 hypothetical protein DXN05_14615 [Deminuibacter soli]
MLQNRVDPWGNLIQTKARGAWMGNRGILHNEQQQVERQFKLKAWLICQLEFKDRKRQVMAPHRYTELFFLDEATAFAAGHRPCFECRREAAEHFKTCWLQANPEHGFDASVSINEIDAVLHRERINRKGEKLTHEAPAAALPNGVFVVWEGKPCLLYNRQLFPWSPAGYKTAIALPVAAPLQVLTPPSVVRSFTAGYQAQVGVNIVEGVKLDV